MRTTPDQLLDELVRRWTQREPLAVDELLAQAGPGADELATLIDAFLERAPRRDPSPESLAYVRALDEPPLLRARQARRLKLDDIVSGLVERLNLSAAAATKVRRYYQQLELGQLDPSGVAASVWDGLGALLGRDARALAGGPLPPLSAPAMYRKADVGASYVAVALQRQEQPANQEEPDEVDRLFGVRPGGRL